ncbi:hypothetical protein DK926_02200 [Rhodococcus sp. Eu-32]|nr:hypothetical protein DK926_02200 [Rhodococcus sp. Eu-32]
MTMETQWGRIVDWCASNAPAAARAFRPGKTPAAVDAAIAASRETWTDELREFYPLQNGIEREDPKTGAFAGSISRRTT